MLSLRDFTPKGLYARNILIVTLPVLLMQGVVTYVFFNRHWEEVNSAMTANAVGDIALLTRLYELAQDRPQLRAKGWDIPVPDSLKQDDADTLTPRAVVKMAREQLDIVFSLRAGQTIPPKDKPSPFSLVNATLDRQLERVLGKPYWYNTHSFPAYVEVGVQLPEGYLAFFVRRDRVVASTGYFFVIWMVAATGLLGFIALMFIRNQVRSIQRLAHVADDFGRGRDAPDFRPSGALEVRQAGRAFIAMRQRIKRQLTQRTQMLAGVSHDLRTPLTRLKLALALRDGDDGDDDTADMKADVDEMEAMLDAYLSFARTQGNEDAEPVHLLELIDEITEDFRRLGHDLSFEIPPEETLYARKGALKRAIVNLVMNGFKHAATVHVSLELGEGYLAIHVDDDGPGIPPGLREEAFKPFARLDVARNQNMPGVGLGLSVVRDVARAHGGDVTLADGPLSGLRASLRIPV